MMTTNLFVIANVKQLRTDGSFRILLPFPNILGCWHPKSAIFNSFRYHDFGGPSEFCGGRGLNLSKTPTPWYATDVKFHFETDMNLRVSI